MQEDVDGHTTIFLHLALQRQGILAPVAGLASRLVERLSSVCPFPVGTEEDACSLPFLLRSLFTAGLRLDFPVFFTPSADVSRFPEARECRKLQESPFEQDPVAFHWKHSPVIRLVKELCPFPLVTAARSVISLWILKFYFFELVQYAISRTFFVCDNLVVLLLAEFLEYTVPWLSELGRILQLGNVQTF